MASKYNRTSLAAMAKLVKPKPVIITGISIRPFFWEGDNKIIQAGGSNNGTDGYIVSKHHSNGRIDSFDDYPTEQAAIDAAEVLAKHCQVPILPYDWMTIQITRLQDRDKAFEEIARGQHFIKDVQRYPNDYPDKQLAGKYGHYDTRNAYDMWNAGIEWARKLYSNQQ